MTDIILATINARYIHTAFGLRYLMANLGELKSRARILEFEIKQNPLEIASEILSHHPRIVGLGIYIWNAALSSEVVAILKRVRPELIVIIGGPEVSFETEQQPVVAWADHVITGEADLKFAEVCRKILSGESAGAKVIHAELPLMEKVELPYDGYRDEDIAHRVLYVEASRGCPFTCEFCLSSLDVPVRAVEVTRFLSELEQLLARGARTFKFVDRTFNLNLNTSRAILEFFLERWQDGMFLHFEMVPDRMPQALLDLLSRFPAGTVQLEVGIQTFDEETSKNISRRQNYAKLEQNIRFLREHTGVHIHADLIVGLPGESLESFGRGFDRLVAMGPQEIQVGILKRLRGTPIIRHDREWGMVYNPMPPYEILQNNLLGFGVLQRLRRFAKYWDLYANSGRFRETLPMVWTHRGSAFENFLQFSDWLAGQVGRTHSIALVVLAEKLYTYLNQEIAVEGVADVFRRDWYKGAIKREVLPFLEMDQSFVNADGVGGSGRMGAGAERKIKRQARHLAG